MVAIPLPVGCGGGARPWRCGLTPCSFKDYDVDPRDIRVIYLGAADANNEEGGLYKTTDGGGSWTRIARKNSECFGATIHPRKPDWVYMCLTENSEDASGAGPRSR